ncbi:MAG: MoaD/ThiS family protein, partial [Burkholderiaceae bacterium]
MKLRLRYFASLREALGAGEALDWDAPIADRPATAGELRAWLRTRSPAHAHALAPGRAVRVAVDQALADDSTPLHDGVEVAFFPPVT